MPQKIDLYTICWNEEHMLPYFFRYYDQFVNKYIVFDDGSTDESLKLLAEHPKVEIRPLPRLEVDSYILAAKEVHDNCWKESRGKADWIIITAIDEFLYVPNGLDSYLQECNKKGITAIPALGYQMISNSLPEKNGQLFELITRGCPWSQMNKLSIFNPNKIKESNQKLGRHSAKPKGKIVYPDKDELLNLHYKYLSFDATFNRHRELNEKLGKADKENNWGQKYAWDKQKFEDNWNYFMDSSIENIHNSITSHSPLNERWWRKEKKNSFLRKILNF